MDELENITGRHRIPAVKIVCAVLACALAVLTCLVVAAWLDAIDLPEPLQERIELLPDPHATPGTLYATETDVPPGSFQLVVNQLCTMEEGSRDCPVGFENPAANGYAARIDVEVEGGARGGSGMVAPGSSLHTVRLDRALPPGEHEAKAIVQVFADSAPLTTLNAAITIRVEDAS